MISIFFRVLWNFFIIGIIGYPIDSHSVFLLDKDDPAQVGRDVLSMECVCGDDWSEKNAQQFSNNWTQSTLFFFLFISCIIKVIVVDLFNR